MAGENDVFSVLGKVEVDLAALRASLGQAEAEVSKSANRQKKSFEEISEAVGKSFFKPQQAGGKGTWWSDPKMAFGLKETGSAADKAARGIGALGAQSGKSVGNMRSLAQSVNLITPGLGGMTSSILQAVRFLGPWGAGLIAVAAVVREYAKAVSEAAERNYEFNRSLELKDISRIKKVMDETGEAFARNRDLLERQGQSWNTLEKAVSGYLASFELGIKEIRGLVTGDPFGGKAAADAAAKFAKANKAIEVPKEVRAFKKEMNKLDEEGIRWWLSYADTAVKLNNGYKMLHETMREGLKLRKEEINSEMERELVGKDAEGQKQVRAKFNRLIIVEEMKVADAIGRSTEDQKRKLAELVTANVMSADKIANAKAQMVQSAINLKIAEIESAEAIIRAQDEMLGRVTSGVATITATYEQQAIAVRAADDAQEASFKRQSANLENLIKQGIEVEKNKRALAEMEADREVRAGETRSKLLEQNARKAAALATEATRVYNAELSRVTGTQEAYFNARKAFGEDTLQSEITFQQTLNGLYKQGTADWYNGMAKVAQLQKQMREEARSTFQGIAGEAAESLKKKGRKNVTIADLQKEAAVLEAGERKTLGEAGRGRSVDPEALFKALGRQPERERFAAQGGSLRDLFERAITPGQTAAGAGVAAPAENFSGLMKASADLFNTGVADFRDAVAAFARANTNGGSSEAQSSRLSSQIGRMGQLESRRGPAPQTAET